MSRKFLPGTFALVSKDALKDRALSLGAKAMLALMQCYDRGNGVVDPSYSQMAEDLNCAKRSAIKYVEELEGRGYIRAVRRRLSAKVNNTNLYQIVFQTMGEDEAVDDLLGGGAKSAPRSAKNSTVVRKTKKEYIPTVCTKAQASLLPEPKAKAKRKPTVGAPTAQRTVIDAMDWERCRGLITDGDRLEPAVANQFIAYCQKHGATIEQIEAVAQKTCDELLEPAQMYAIIQSQLGLTKLRVARHQRHPDV